MKCRIQQNHNAEFREETIDRSIREERLGPSGWDFGATGSTHFSHP